MIDTGQPAQKASHYSIPLSIYTEVGRKGEENGVLTVSHVVDNVGYSSSNLLACVRVNCGAIQSNFFSSGIHLKKCINI
jgi:hypothetical protein